MTGPALQTEIQRVDQRRKDAIGQGLYLEATMLGVSLDLLKTAEAIDVVGGAFSEAQSSLHKLRTDAEDNAHRGGDPAMQRQILMDLPVGRLRAALSEFNMSAAGCIEKEDFLRRLGWTPANEPPTFYVPPPPKKDEPTIAFPKFITKDRKMPMKPYIPPSRVVEIEPQTKHTAPTPRKEGETLSADALSALPVTRLRKMCQDAGLSDHACLEKADFVALLSSPHAARLQSTAWPPTETADEERAAPVSAYKSKSFQRRQYWRKLKLRLQDMQSEHAELSPARRRSASWARTFEFAKVLLGEQLLTLRQATEEEPLVIWVLLASNAVEGELVERGFLDDMNWSDGTRTEVYVFGIDHVQEPRPQHCSHTPPVIRAASYDAMAELLTAQKPDLLVTFMPSTQQSCRDIVEGFNMETWLEQISEVPLIVTCRERPPEGKLRNLASTLGKKMLVPMARSAFSAVPASGSAFDDNGWFFIVQGLAVLDTVLDWKAAVEEELSGVPPLRSEIEPPPDTSKLSVAHFWGIVDIKYDSARPATQRVKVLETGDGRISKFSRDGGYIRQKREESFRIRQGAGPQKYTVVSTDKRLTHDLMEDAGYGDVVPRQVCFLRQYLPDLANQILRGLDLAEDATGEVVVLKLCNRSRGAGVLMVRVGELDSMLKTLLEPPKDLEEWMQRGLERLAKKASDLGLGDDPMEEQMRHWWSNESPCFVAERFFSSEPTVRDGKAYDGTMRVSFVLRHREGVPEPPSYKGYFEPHELEVEWLGGYWKLPKADLDNADIRDRSVSAARASGTAPVAPAQLHEVYAVIGDAMRDLFGGPEPDMKVLGKRYKEQPELHSYLFARLGMSSMKDPEKVKNKLEMAEEILYDCEDRHGQMMINSFLNRAWGIITIRTSGVHACSRDQWQEAETFFRKAVACVPTNANALFWLGMAALELGKLDEAIEKMNRSLLLDPDFKGPYVNLGVAYLKKGDYDKVIEISNAGLARHPQSPQCNYHLGVASYQQALEYRGGHAHSELAEISLHVAADMLRVARESEEAQKRVPVRTGRLESPWLDFDEEMVSEVESVIGGHSTNLRALRIPMHVGWRFLNWRT